MLAQLIRRMRGGDENPFGDDTSTPQKILQLLTEVSVCTYILIVRKEFAWFNVSRASMALSQWKPFVFSLEECCEAILNLSFFSDRGSSIWCLGIWIGIATLLAMCSGIWSCSLRSSLIKTCRYSEWSDSFLNPQAANDCELETVAYEFFTKAYLLYEEEISVSDIFTRLQVSL